MKKVNVSNSFISKHPRIIFYFVLIFNLCLVLFINFDNLGNGYSVFYSIEHWVCIVFNSLCIILSIVLYRKKGWYIIALASSFIVSSIVALGQLGYVLSFFTRMTVLESHIWGYYRCRSKNQGNWIINPDYGQSFRFFDPYFIVAMIFTSVGIVTFFVDLAKYIKVVFMKRRSQLDYIE